MNIMTTWKYLPREEKNVILGRIAFILILIWFVNWWIEWTGRGILTSR